MSLVGEFPGFSLRSRMPVRAPVNPLDKCTIVSVYPKEIRESKPTMTPADFHIEAGSEASPKLLVIGPSSWFKEIDENQPLLEIPVSSIQVADSFIRDYCGSILGSDGVESSPGIFYVPGEKKIEEIKKEFPHLLTRAVAKQKKWFQTLVGIADMLWARTNGNPLVISDDARMAAQMLNLNDKPWIKDFQAVQLTNCKACGTLVNPLYPICANCKAIVNEELAKTAGIKFAQ